MAGKSYAGKSGRGSKSLPKFGYGSTITSAGRAGGGSSGGSRKSGGTSEQHSRSGGGPSARPLGSSATSSSAGGNATQSRVKVSTGSPLSLEPGKVVGVNKSAGGQVGGKGKQAPQSLLGRSSSTPAKRNSIASSATSAMVFKSKR